jgi:RluA family pseudouridine synthase
MKIIHSDEQILVINKPANLPVLPEGWDKDAPCLVKMLEEQYGRVWVVHRIDKVTSGILLVARNAQAHRTLSIQFEKHEMEKKYHAIVVGIPKWDEKTAKHPLRVNVGHRHRTIVDDKSGVSSETRFKILKRGESSALVEAMPITGRTHQIRVHLFALGHPLLGDSLYSAPETNLITRPALHAYSLTITHPESNQRVTFLAPHPKDFEDALKKI